MNTKKEWKSNGKGRTRVRSGLAALFVLGLLIGGAFSAAPPEPERSRPIGDLVRNLEVGRPVSHGNLTIVPVYLTRIHNRTAYPTLDEALKNGWIEIAELDGGRVPQVRISNRSKNTIYLMGGEILSGAKQDRILASDLLLGPGTKDLIAPVYCVEHGRWTARTESFTSRSNLGTFDLRAKAQDKSGGAQAEIWDRVAEQNAKVGVASPTSAYQDAYESDANKAKIRKIEERMAEIPRLYKDTVGVMIGLGEKIVSVDIFLNPALFEKQWPKILRSSALSSLGHDGRGTLAPRTAADFLKAFIDKDFQAKKGLDLGVELSCVDDSVSIQALAYEDGILHLAAFPQEQSRLKVGGPLGPEQRLRVIRD